MEEWKFLLQKNGDRSWLPLDSPDAEILEGRYRLVARSSQVNTEIGIRVCHLATEEDPPKRRIHKRSSRTNENGLMVVIPFTHLEPGIWELSCFSTDLMSDLIGDTLHHTVCLRVIALAEADLDEWHESPYGQENEALLAGQRLDAGSSEPAGQGQQSEFLIPSDAEATEIPVRSLPSPLPFKPEEPSSVQEAAVTAVNALTLRLQLQNNALMASRGQVFTLSGQVVVDDLAQLETEIPASWLQSGNQSELALATPSETQPDTASTLAGVVAQELQLCLRDPQSSTVILQQQHPLLGGTPPLNFKFIVSLPYTLATHLLLGEVVLYGTRPGQEEAAIALQVAPFTITVDPENLVEELKKVHTALNTAMLEEQSRGEELADLAAQFSAKLRREKLKSTLDLSFLDLTTPVPGVEGLPTPQPTPQAAEVLLTQMPDRSGATVETIQPRPKQILPPQLYPPIERPAGRKQLELPVFNRVTSAPPLPPQEAALIDDLFTAALEDPLEEPLSFKIEEPEPEEIVPEVAGSEAIAVTHDAVQPPAIAPESANLNQLPDSMAPPADALPSIDEEDSLPVRLEFQSLNLQERFLDRLNRMAGDQLLMASLKRSLRPTTTESVVPAHPQASEIEPESAMFAEVGAMAKEVVVEDDPSWRDQTLRVPRLRSRSDTAATIPLALPEDTPIPIPRVEILTNQIIAGSTMPLRVKLPDHLPPTCVKLWISDRQTRVILDGPRWLMDLSPNGLDEVVTNLQIDAPEGSLEIRIEAIAVELQTQRESQKVSLDRSVTSPELPDLWDDELEEF